MEFSDVHDPRPTRHLRGRHPDRSLGQRGRAAVGDGPRRHGGSHDAGPCRTAARAALHGVRTRSPRPGRQRGRPHLPPSSRSSPTSPASSTRSPGGPAGPSRFTATPTAPPAPSGRRCEPATSTGWRCTSPPSVASSTTRRGFSTGCRPWSQPARPSRPSSWPTGNGWASRQPSWKRCGRCPHLMGRAVSRSGSYTPRIGSRRDPRLRRFPLCRYDDADRAVGR